MTNCELSIANMAVYLLPNTYYLKAYALNRFKPLSKLKTYYLTPYLHPRSMAVIKVPTSFNIDVEFEIPEFYRRLVALLIDWVLIFLFLRAGLYFLNQWEEEALFDDDKYLTIQILKGALIVPALLYFPLMEITTNGRSAGKMIMHLRVINENGGKPNIGQFMIRWLLRYIWFIMLLIVAFSLEREDFKAIGYFLLILAVVYFVAEVVLVAASPKGQRLGDMLAHTILVSTNVRGNIEDTVFQEVESTYQPAYPQIMQLSDRDINAIKSILTTARKKNDFDLAANAADRIKTHLKIETSMSPFDFLEILLKDYNYLSTR